MTRRWRSLRYGPAGALVLVGVACGAVIPGTAGGTLATALIGLGLVGVVSFIFYEVGLSEDRERSDAQRRAARPPESASSRPPRSPARPRRPERMRGQRRRLR